MFVCVSFVNKSLAFAPQFQHPDKTLDSTMDAASMLELIMAETTYSLNKSFKQQFCRFDFVDWSMILVSLTSSWKGSPKKFFYLWEHLPTLQRTPQRLSPYLPTPGGCCSSSRISVNLTLRGHNKSSWLCKGHHFAVWLRWGRLCGSWFCWECHSTSRLCWRSCSTSLLCWGHHSTSLLH